MVGENEMIMVLVNEGQMCNQLLTLSSAYALGLEYNTAVKCPVMDIKLKDSFVFRRENETISVQMNSSTSWKMVAFALKCMNKIFLKKDKKKCIEIKKGKIKIFYDWGSIKNDIIFAKHQDEIREFFAFKPQIIKKCFEKINEIKKSNEIIVGVHIRRGDYKAFHDGQWFYSDEEYSKWMKILSGKANIKFVIFSNEKINKEYL